MSTPAGYTYLENITGCFPTFKRIPAWQAGFDYAQIGFLIRDTQSPTPYLQRVSTAGVSGSPTSPAFTPVVGVTFTDGTGSLVWTNQGVAPAGPPDALITQFALDVQGDIDAVLYRRFFEAISATPYNGSFTAWIAAVIAGQDASDVLEKINRFGAAAQLGQVFASFGVKDALDLAKDAEGNFSRYFAALNGEDEKGKPKDQGGIYDRLFDVQSRTPTPRPGLTATAGGNLGDGVPPGFTPFEIGLQSWISYRGEKF